MSDMTAAAAEKAFSSSTDDMPVFVESDTATPGARPTGRLGPVEAEPPSSPYGTTRWLIRVRWVAVIGQLTSILIVVGPIGLELPVGPLLQIVAFTLLTNVVLALWVGRGAVRDDRAAFDPSPGFGQVCGPIMLVDIATLTGLLYLSGGPGNPFVVFYFVNLCLAAFLLPRPWAWAAAVLATVGVVAIAYVHVPLPALEADDVFPQLLGRDEPATLYQQGSLLAFIACGAVIVTFTGTLREQLRRNEHAMRRVRDELARGQRLDALGTLAAGAAHELANPLGTVAVVIGEMQRRLQRDPTRDPDGRLAKDLRLSRDEIDRCRSILDLMLADAGQSLGETPTEATVGELIEEVLDGVREVGRVEVVCDDATDALRLEVPIVGLGQAFRGLVRNAIAASPDEAAVVLRVAPDGPTRIRVSVEDRGSGMPPEVLKKAGEPFFTTKEAGKGTGLGLFLARAVVEWLGGTWSIASKPGEGTTVAATIPVSASRF